MEMILTSAPVYGEELERLGLISRALPAGQVLPAAIVCARMIASKSGPVVQLAKQAILAGRHQNTTALQASLGVNYNSP